MKRFFILALVLGVGVGLGRVFDGVSKMAAAGGGQGGVAVECAAKNGDVNGSGKVDLSDATTILGHLFLGNPTKLVGLCDTPKLEACQAELVTTQAALVSSQEKLAQCQGKPSGLPDTGQTALFGDCAGQDGRYATGCPNDANRFTNNLDGTVTDNCTGLMWQKDTADVNGDGQTPDDRSDALNWCNALAYCENLRFAGHDDWRLPNVRELQSIADYERVRPSIDPVFGALSSFYWSSTSVAGNPDGAWLVGFHHGNVSNNGGKDYFYYVRAVRSGP